MATETQERTDSADKVELATKADVVELSTDVAELSTDVAELSTDVAELSTKVTDLSTKVTDLSTKVDNHGHELTSIRVELRWMRWTLGVIVVMLMALFGAAIAIALQI